MMENNIKNKIKVLALDLDGTLTNEDKGITERTKKAIHYAIGRGIKIVLASGRPTIGITHVAEQLQLQELGGYIAGYNGGQITDCKTGEIVFESKLPKKCYSQICRLAKERGLDALSYDHKGVLTEAAENQYVLREAYNCGIPVTKVESLEETVTWDVVKFMLVGDVEKIARHLKFFQEKFEGLANVFLSEPWFMEFAAPGIDKAAGLKQLIDHLNITKDELCAVGDGLNDITMLGYAGHAVAMGNSCNEVMAIADFITKSNDEDGVAVFIEEFL